MKKKIHKIWGVGLVVVLAASLLLAAAPVSASELAWGTEGIPSTTDNIIVNNIKIQDFAAAGDGMTIYAAVNGANIYKSTDGGKTWGTKTPSITATKVAVAPDDPDLVVVASATSIDVSTNGGTSFTNLGTIDANLSVINGIAVSPDDSGYHYVGVAGDETGTNDANAWSYKLGAIGATWQSLRVKNGFGSGTGAAAPLDTCEAVAFSPNFASDKMMLVVTYETDETGFTDVVYLEIYSFNYDLWNQDAALTSYPVTIESDTDITACAFASLTVSPEYLGSDDAMRIVFVGLDVTATTDSDNDGIYRLKDTSVKALSDGKDVFSIDYDGTNLVAGQVGGSAVYRSDDPLASSPTVSTASSLKRLLGTNVVVAWSDSDVLCATRGTFSAFGVSHDNGKSFNGLSMVDYGAKGVVVMDVAVSNDGSVIYLLTEDDANAYALWRKASAWEMVFNKATNVAMGMVRVAPDNSYSVYIAEDMNASQTLYYSNQGGDTKWFLRTAKANVTDLTVESEDAIYSSTAGNVYRSTNSGFTWGDAKSAGVDTVWMIRSLGEDTLIASGTGGKVAFSSDGGQTWSKPHATKYPFSANNVFVTATGVSDGDFIYCASYTNSSNIVRWEIGTSTSWSDIIVGTIGANELATGIELSEDGVLYVLAKDTAAASSIFYRTLSPSTADSATTWSTANQSAVTFDIAPDALILASGSTKVWSADTANEAVYSYEDTVAASGPLLSGPGDGGSVNINPISGGTFNVPFTWDRLSKATKYDIQAALDTGFVEKIVDESKTTSDATAFYNAAANTFMPDTTYYWHVRLSSDGPIYSPWSKTRSFTIAELPEAEAPVIIQQPPAPVISVPPAPAITIQPPEIVLPPYPAPAPAPEIVIPPAPAPAPAVPGWALWAIIIIGAVLVIALIVLIMRTRRPI